MCFCETCKSSERETATALAAGGKEYAPAAEDNSKPSFRVNVAQLRGRALMDSGTSIDFVDRQIFENAYTTEDET